MNKKKHCKKTLKNIIYIDITEVRISLIVVASKRVGCAVRAMQQLGEVSQRRRQGPADRGPFGCDPRHTAAGRLRRVHPLITRYISLIVS